ncbi:hypothetical protein HNQ79_001950 [Streptomyces candidus]|uniref:Uncharacterized protein n=1 Tax=Streptomyces candidus TaxID=67283 RepID=A0A7X0LNI0_9ACTN|nr:DUF6227 family protein [Streptomyces candidus]MBB6435493.1 hypothetical protein [Streptomyces candidus]
MSTTSITRGDGLEKSLNDPHEYESDGLETTEDHLGRLLGRALNSFDLPDETVERLDTALAHSSSLRSSHHSAGLRRSLYRHAFLLADGSSLTLWELVHNAGRDRSTEHELYVDVGEARLAANRLPREAGSPAGDLPLPSEYGDGSVGFSPHGFSDDLCDGFSDDLSCGQAGGVETDLETLAGLLAHPHRQARRAYVPDESADHARRVLRRAENADRPGPETARLLADALAHEITQVYGRQCRIKGRAVGFTLYEHAFLLLDGSEASVWEVEHTATPDGRHMCEVYADERTAREAMEPRGRVG